jgi:ATP-dependent RNA helicase RhlE
MSEQSFAELGVSKAVVGALTARGITAPFQIQREVIGDVLAGRDVLARSPTGSGKTLAFGIPLIDRTAAEARRPAALILAPTRELATQIVDELQPIAHARALRVAAVYGGVGLLKQAANAARAHIIVATPGRLEDQLSRRAFDLSHVRTLIIDEADRMLDMGFRPALDRIVDLCPSDRQTLFFSATLDGEAGKAARRYTNNAAFHEHGPSERRASLDVEHRFVETTHAGRIDTLLETLNGERDLALVFVRTKHGADKLVKKLEGEGIRAVAMHGNKTQRQRERALADFEGFRVDTLVATDVAARGIDVAGISHVVNFDPPHDSETYVHRIGRTGRAGATGIGVTLVSPDQRREILRMCSDLGIQGAMGADIPGLGAGGFNRGERPQHSAPRSGGSARTGEHRPSRGPRGGDAHRPESRGSRSESRGPRSDSRGPRSESRGPRSGGNGNGGGYAGGGNGKPRKQGEPGYKPTGSGYRSGSQGRKPAGQGGKPGGQGRSSRPA